MKHPMQKQKTQSCKQSISHAPRANAFHSSPCIQNAHDDAQALLSPASSAPAITKWKLYF